MEIVICVAAGAAIGLFCHFYANDNKHYDLWHSVVSEIVAQPSEIQITKYLVTANGELALSTHHAMDGLLQASGYFLCHHPETGTRWIIRPQGGRIIVGSIQIYGRPARPIDPDILRLRDAGLEAYTLYKLTNLSNGC